MSGLSRRAFFSNLLVGVTAIAEAKGFGQRSVMEKGKAVVCDGMGLRCPNGHQTCPTIDAPLVIGNQNRNYPDSTVLFDYTQVRCDICHVLFTLE